MKSIWKNFFLKAVDADIQWADTFLNDRHKGLKADYVLANPPFNDEDWGFSKVKKDVRWAFGTPPPGGARKQKDGVTIHVDGGNANYAWIQHFVHHLSPNGTADFVLANGSVSTNTSGEGEIRRKLIEADMMDCMIALPGQLFYTTQIPVCLWFVTRSKKADAKRGYRNRQGETLFIDARKKGALINRTHRELSTEELAEIGRTYHAWRGEKKDGSYEDKPGFCKSATLDEIKSHHHVLTPGRYVGAEAVADDGIPFEKKMAELSGTLYEQMAQALFKSWFVDFDPVIDNALAAGNEIPEELREKSKIRKALGDERKALPEDIRKRFPSEFEHTEEMGRIPKGWKVSTVGEEFNVTMGQSPPGFTYNETGEGIPFFQGRADFGFRYPSKRVYCTAPNTTLSHSVVIKSVG